MINAISICLYFACFCSTAVSRDIYAYSVAVLSFFSSSVLPIWLLDCTWFLCSSTFLLKLIILASIGISQGQGDSVMCSKSSYLYYRGRHGCSCVTKFFRWLVFMCRSLEFQVSHFSMTGNLFIVGWWYLSPWQVLLSLLDSILLLLVFKTVNMQYSVGTIPNMCTCDYHLAQFNINEN